MNVKFKRFLVCICIVCSLFSFVRPYRANAVVPLVVVSVGGAVIATSVLVSLMIKAGETGGYSSVSTYSEDLRSYLESKILAMTATELLTYFGTAQDSSNNDYVALTPNGYDYSKQTVGEIKTIPQFERYYFSSTTNTVKNNTSSYMLNGYCMKPYAVKPSGGIYDSFYVSANSGLKVCFGDSTSSWVWDSSSTFNSSYSYYVRFIMSSNTYFQIQYSMNNVNWNTTAGTSVGSFVHIGYNSNSNTVYVPGSNVITSGGSTTSVGTDQSVATSISGQYDSTTGQTVYTGIEGATAGVISGLTFKDLSTTGTNTGTATGVTADTITDGINASDVGDLSIPSTDVPTLDFTPLMVATQKFPFCVPWDIAYVVKNFSATAKCPTYTFKDVSIANGAITIPGFTVDISTVPNIDILLNITKFFELVYFVWFLINRTRSLIKV